MTATVIRTVTILGICLDIIRTQGRLWITARDLAMVLGYKSESSIRQAYYRHRKHDSIEGHVIKVFVGGYGGSPCRLFDEVAAAFFCQNRKRQGAFELLRWIEAGGMQFEGADTSAFELSAPASPITPKAPVLALVPSTPAKVPSEHQERTKAYCRELLKTLLRYADEDDTEHLRQVVEGEVVGLISHRYCQGLNDARYELYRRFWLQGGAV